MLEEHSVEYWVPARQGKWELADYDFEAEQITAINDSTGGLLVPTVKMEPHGERASRTC